MAWTYEQNFDALDTADLNGQDSWAGNAVFDVEATVYYGASGKAVSSVVSNVNILRDITDITTGKFNFYMRAASTSGGGGGLVLRDETSGRLYFMMTGGNFQAYNDDASPGYDVLQAYSANTWYKITIDFLIPDIGFNINSFVKDQKSNQTLQVSIVNFHRNSYKSETDF